MASLDFHHFVEWDEEAGAARYFRTQNDVALYTDADFRDAFTAAGLDVIRDDEGLMDRGLHVAPRSRPPLPPGERHESSCLADPVLTNGGDGQVAAAAGARARSTPSRMLLTT